MNIPLSTALRLFCEANNFEAEKSPHGLREPDSISQSSEIRRIAKDTFGQAMTRELKIVCCEIFRVVANYHITHVMPTSKTAAIDLLEGRIKELEHQNGLLQAENTRLVLARQEVEQRLFAFTSPDD